MIDAGARCRNTRHGQLAMFPSRSYLGQQDTSSDAAGDGDAGVSPASVGSSGDRAVFGSERCLFLNMPARDFTPVTLPQCSKFAPHSLHPGKNW